MPVLRISGLAEGDLEQIADFIARDNPQAADEFFYQQVPGGIEVLRVLHGARDIRKL
ncbi:MAG: type II toxin-antitoxin system RelE/ParE family toxin [Actinomycetota bacterium]